MGVLRFRTWLLFRSPDFRSLWIGQTISTFGDQVTALALPTVAIVLLRAAPFEVGLLTTVSFLGYPLLGLVAGVWADRLPRRRILLAANAVRMLTLASIPAAAAAGRLGLWQLYVVGAVVGSTAVFFDVAYQAYVPGLVERRDIGQANARLELSNSVAQASGPALSGLLIQAVGAANAIVADALSYGASIAGLVLIRQRERPPAHPRASLVPEVRDGLALVFRHPVLSRLLIATTVANLGRGMALELFLLYAYRALSLSPGVAGTLLAVGSAGALAGAVLTTPLRRRLGLGRSLILASVVKGVPWIFAPLASASAAPAAVMAAIIGLSSFFIPVWNVNNLSLRQAIVAPHLQGRVAATFRTISWAALPVSGFLGGVLAQAGTAALGQRAGLAAVLALGGSVWSLATLALPIRRIARLRSEPVS